MRSIGQVLATPFVLVAFVVLLVVLVIAAPFILAEEL